MKCTPLSVLLAAAGFSALMLGCSGAAPPGDAGFFPTQTSGTGGYYGGTGGYYGGTGGFSGTGGAFGGGNQQGQDGGQVERRLDAAAGPGPGNPGGGGPPNRRRDAGTPADAASTPDAAPPADASPVAACPGDAMSGAACMMGGATCVVPAGDGGRGAICTCRERGGSGAWRCARP